MTTLLTLSVVVFGIFCYRELPVNDLPNVDYPVITVSAFFPGMEPSTMASNVATPLEREFMKIQGLQLVTSSSSMGTTRITLQFNLDRNIDGAASDVQAAISRAGSSLPPDLPSPPVYEKTDPNSHPIFFLALISNSMTLGQLYDYASTQIGQRMSILPGVSQVAVYGVPRAVRINVDPQKLYNKGITMDDVAKAVQAGSVTLSKGVLQGRSTSFIITTNGQLDTADDYDNLIIAYRDNAAVYVKDVADAVESLETTTLRMNFWGRIAPKFQSGVILAVIRAPGANTIAVSEAIWNLVPQFKVEIPGSISLIPLHDRASSIISSLNDVKETLLIAFALVVMVIFVFLGRLTDTVIPAVALPLSILITFVCMYALNFSIDNLSLMAIVLGIGFLVDDAIVFLENMVRRMEEGESRREAAINGAKQISFTILSMTLSLAAVFIPLVFMGGQLGRIFREFSITIIVAILASGVVSLTVTPLLCARILKERGDHLKTAMERFIDRIEDKVLAVYGSSLHWFMNRRLLSVGIWALCLVGTIHLMTVLPKSFLPVGDSGVIMGVFIAHEASSPDQMKKYQEQVDKVIRRNPNVDYTLTLVNASQFLSSSQGFCIIFLKDRHERPPIADIVDQLRKELFMVPGVLALVRPLPALEINTGATENRQGQYAYALSGINSEELFKAAFALQMSMAQLPGMASVSSDLFMRSPQLRVNILRDKASMLGINVHDIEQMLKNAYSENYVYLIKAPTQQYQVIVVADERYRADPENLDVLYIRSQTGDMVPLSAVATWEAVPGPQSVNHINNFPSVTIFFDLKPGYSIGEATAAVQKLADQMVPAGIIRNFQGEAKAFGETIASLTVLLIVAVFVMYVILGVLYESYIHPITVLSSLPVATIGGLATLYLARFLGDWLMMVPGGYSLGRFLSNAELSLYAYIGLFMLMGIVKKNGIMMIDFAIELQKGGQSPYDAIHKACLVRFRPILMTTLAAFVGSLPIALGYGEDGASRMPLGFTIVGGMAFSQLITLYITPVIYLYMEEFQEKVLDKMAFFRRQV